MRSDKNTGFIAHARWLLLPVLLAGVACSERQDEQPPVQPAPNYAELVLINGGIYTVDADRSWAEAAAVRDGAFVSVGSNVEIEPLIGPETRIIDLAGRMALPGFHDAHVHPTMGGYALLGCDLEGLSSVESIIEAVTTCAGDADKGWLEGHAFNLSLFGQDGPHKSLLDAISMTRPIILWASDGHNAWANSTALELAGITAETPDPALGVIERDPDGSPSGTLRETAQELVRAAMPKPTLDDNVEALRAGITHLNSFGVTSFIDAWVGLEDYQSYQAIDQAGGLTARVVTSLTYESGFAKHRGDEFEQVLAGRHAYESERIHHGSVKLFLDGVLEGETAALVDPYVGMHGKRGDLILEPEALNAAVTRFDAMGLQVHMHAIGDRAVRAGLDAIEAARLQNGASDNRHHISHLQLIHIDDIERFGALDTAANFQALWAWPDDWIMELNLPVLGEERVQGMYPIASVARGGGRIVGGSDWNVSSANPLDAIETAIRRQDAFDDGGPALNENERVSLGAMIDAYTINAAWVMHQEERSGSIEVGKQADIVVLDRNIFEVPETEINEAKVLITLLAGETIWARRASADESTQ
ncbi:MAG: amidohydrolase family protein [Xanthomonadales bacterium]|nr:amidohydrolase family protein [Xanthomonadales bacterium]